MASRKRGEKTPSELREETRDEAQKIEPGLQIIEMMVENIKRIRLAHIKPKGSVVTVSGKNGSGKTSLLDAIAWGLTGTSTVPSMPIRKGQRTGSVKIDLGDFVVIRHFSLVDPTKSAKGNTYFTKLTVEGKHREQYPSPQVLLNALMGKISFDPLAFTRMDEKEQLKTLRGLVTFDIDPDALQAEIKAAYEERREAGRIYDGAKARLAAMAQPEENLPLHPVDVNSITEKLEGAANHNSRVEQLRRKKAGYEEAVVSFTTEAQAKHARAIQRRKEADELDVEGAEFTRQAEEAKTIGESVEIPETLNTAELALEISNANSLNARIHAAERYNQVADEVSDSNAEWERLDKIVKDRTNELQDALARAKMPIDGLGIGDDEVLYKGLPFGQASNAEQIQVSMALAMASNPKLRVLRIADGSLLDSDSFDMIAAAAAKHRFQMWIERVDTTGKVGIVMEDGEASGDEVISDEVKG